MGEQTKEQQNEANLHQQDLYQGIASRSSNSETCPHTKVFVTDSTMRRNKVPCPWCKDAEIERLRSELWNVADMIWSNSTRDDAKHWAQNIRVSLTGGPGRPESISVTIRPVETSDDDPLGDGVPVDKREHQLPVKSPNRYICLDHEYHGSTPCRWCHDAPEGVCMLPARHHGKHKTSAVETTAPREGIRPTTLDPTRSWAEQMNASAEKAWEPTTVEILEYARRYSLSTEEARKLLKAERASMIGAVKTKVIPCVWQSGCKNHRICDEMGCCQQLGAENGTGEICP